MILLGIDPGSLKAGYALIKCEGRKLSYIDSGTLRYSSDQQLIDRLGPIYKSCEDLIDKYRPDEIACESLIYVKSVTALSKLAQARGAMLAAFVKEYEGKVFEYSPNLVKSTVSGHGHASKESIQKSLSLIFGNKKFATSDESDALAVAVCHALNRGRTIAPTSQSNRKTGRTLKQIFKARV